MVSAKDLHALFFIASASFPEICILACCHEIDCSIPRKLCIMPAFCRYCRRHRCTAPLYSHALIARLICYIQLQEAHADAYGMPAQYLHLLCNCCLTGKEQTGPRHNIQNPQLLGWGHKLRCPCNELPMTPLLMLLLMQEAVLAYCDCCFVAG